MALKVTCVSSFPDVPHLQLSYSQHNQQVAQNLMLPIVVSKFCTPPDNPVPKEVFFSRWRAIAGQLLCALHACNLPCCAWLGLLALAKPHLSWAC